MPARFVPAFFDQAHSQQSAASPPTHETSLTIAIATASIAFVPLLHTFNPLLAIATETLVAGAIAVTIPGYAPSVAIFVLLFQNLFVSIFSSYISGPAELDFIKGYNFLSCAVMWLTTFALYALKRRDRSPQVNRLMAGSTLALGVVTLYFVAGVVQNGLSASIYLRNIVLPLFLFQLALLTSATYEIRMTPILIAIGVLLIVCGYVELVFRDFWLDITNGYSYWRLEEIKATNSGVWEREMRATGEVFVTLKDRFSFDFLNTPLLSGLGLSKILRIFGPNISAISFAYGVSFFTLFLFSIGRPLLGIAALPLLVFCGVKGALIQVMFVAVAWISTRLLGPVVTLVLGLLALIVYAIAGLHIGLQIGDYHALGFMGGWNGFLQAPFGRGLGAGGNLSGDFSSIDWRAAQEAGAVDGAVESAVGVLLYQMGLAAAVPLGFYVIIAIKAWRLYAASGLLTQGLAAFGILVVLLNGIFQEEALFGPPALGLLTCLAGLVIGNAVRASAAISITTRTAQARFR